jgi:hypothetical protein
MKMKAILLAALLAGTGSVYAESKHTMADFLALAHRSEQVSDAILFTASGYSGANVYLDNHNQPRIYCQPKDLAMGGDQYVSIMERYVEDSPTVKAAEEDIWQNVLLLALRRQFPCPDAKP